MSEQNEDLGGSPAAGRWALIPGIDPEITVHRRPDAFVERIKPEQMSCADLRDERGRFGERAEAAIQAFPRKFEGPWFRFNSMTCEVEGAVVGGGMVYHGGLPVVGVTRRTQRDLRTAHLVSAGDLAPPEPAVHYTGRTALVIGQSGFNYYHFIVELLSTIEDLLIVDPAGIDSIVMHSRGGEDGSFQWELIREVYPEIADRIVFDTRPFSAQRLVFVCLRPGNFAHSDDNGLIVTPVQRGVGGKEIWSNVERFFERAGRRIGAAGRDGPKVLLISRRQAAVRQIVNEDDLHAAIEPLGAHRVSMETLSVREQMEMMAAARVVIGGHGAGMINIGFCRPGATGIEISARQYLQRAPDFSQLSIARNVRYHVAICDEAGDIDEMRGNVGNDIRLSERAIDHIVSEVRAALERVPGVPANEDANIARSRGDI